MLDEVQEKIVEATEEKIVVSAAPAAGKTAVLTERVKWLIDNGQNPNKMVVITFTNAAAEEMRERIGYNDPALFIGTIHSYVNKMLNQAGIDTTKMLKDEDFDGLFEAVKKHPECMRPIEVLLLDEAQDTDRNQWEVLLDILNPPSFFIVGDYDQSIYGWRQAKPQMFLDIMRRPDVKVYNLKRNYRNGRQIIDYAERMLDKYGLDKSICATNQEGYVSEIMASPQSIAQEINEDGNWKNWFLIFRRWRDTPQIEFELSKLGIPYEIIKRSKYSNDELNGKLNSDTVKIMSIHGSKGLEASKVMVINAIMSDDPDNEESRCNYVAATRAKDELYWVTVTKPKYTKKQKNKKVINWA